VHPNRRSMMTRTLLTLGGVAAVGVGSAMARPAPPEPCPLARYLVTGDPLAGKASGMQVGSSVSLDDLCDPVAPKKLKASRKGVTQFLVKWKQCNGLKGTVILQGKILPGCTQLEGMLKAKKFKRKFTATRSRCGDGILDPRNGEACDDGNTANGDGCERDCQKTPGQLPTPTTTTSSTSPPTTTSPVSTTTSSTAVTTTTTTTTIAVSTTTSSTPATTTTTTRAPVTTTSTTTTRATTTTRLTTSTTTIRGTTTTTTRPQTVLGLVMIANPDPVAPAGLVTYELTATNRGPVDAVQAVLRLTLPTGVFACGTPSDAGQLPTGCAAGTDVVWTLGTMAVGTSRTVRIFVQIRGDVASGTNISATARLDDAAFSPEATAQATVIAQAANPLTLALTEDADPVRVGDDLEYVLRFGNDSATALLATQLAITLPAGTTVVDAGGGTQASGMITWSLGALNAGQAGERRARVHVDDLAPGDPLVRVARATITSGTVTARASVVAQIGATALGLVLVAEPDPLAPAGLLTYRLIVTDHGVTDADQVQVRLTLPVDTFACAPPSDGGTTPEGCTADRDVLWTVDTLAAGTSRSVQLTIQIRGDTPTGTTLLTAARVEDASGARARAGLGTTVQSAPPLGLVLTTDADPVRVGDDLVYVLRFGNDGGTALLATQLALVLPAGVTVVDAGGGTQASGTITWSLGALNAAQTDERRVRVHVENLAPDDPLVRVARATISSGATAARAAIVTQVQATSLGLGVVAEPDPVAPGGLVSYRLTVANHGLADAVQTELRLTLPVGVFACAPASDGGTTPDSCLAGRDIVWALDTLAAGTTRSVQVAIQIRGDTPTGTIL
jgi:cysteine-rich repeat protein